MALILSIETSTPVCSAALSRNGELIDVRESFDEKSHATSLTIFIQELFDQNGFKPSDIDAVAVSEGPGSYTGLRIGVSVAKGLCFGLNKPLIAIDTLKAMALMASDKIENKPKYYCSMIDARRMEVYTALFDANFQKTEETRALIIDSDPFPEMLSQHTVAFFGNGSDKCRTIIDSSNAIFIGNIYPSAKYMGVLAFEAFQKAEFRDVAYFEPFYLKDFVATIPKQKGL
jgi:tRNA threonylcarbamoyladenosine biosynthesis protein TsaB